jgi:para-aminobenzoate synthetase/4-amino-4-deoxychorismate lyase
MSSTQFANNVIIYDETECRWLRFQQPERILTTSDISQVESLLAAVEHEVNSNQRYAAGFVTYEAAPAFDPSFPVQTDGSFPLVWFGIYRSPDKVDFPEQPPGKAAAITWHPSVTDEEYRSSIAKVKQYIYNGDTYQVNYTFRLQSFFSGDPWDLFCNMIHAQGNGLGAYINTDNWCICSASHELFFRLDGQNLITRPMKGTVPRGLQNKDDRCKAAWLKASDKNRAENLMIVDMVRNDLGRVAETGSVVATSMFDIEKYPTLWQMTSTVCGLTGKSFVRIMQALFPCASITGAPKKRTMEIIRELESTPRKLYTGTIGYLAPGRQAQFSVAIRTVLFNKQNSEVEYGTGGGIVWDSDSADELQECLTKARIVTHGLPAFALLETVLWTPGEGCLLLDEHLQRLQDSADYFSRKLDTDAIRRQISGMVNSLPHQPCKIRVLADKQGNVQLEARPCPELRLPYRITLAARPVNSDNAFLYHKTTHRTLYESAMNGMTGYDDVLLWNENNQVTESCIANVVVELGNELYTPPVSCGLLPGVYRNELLRTGKIRERIIGIDELRNCTRIFLINSVRRMWEVQLDK